MPDSQPVIEVNRVFKKYCRNLKKSMWYGLRDLGTELSGGDHERRKKLRPGEFYALRNISFEVRKGECIALLGPNGAGKSTMMKVLNGLLKPNAGCVEIRGRAGALIELGTGFNPQLSGRENIFINGAVLGLSRREIESRYEEILDFSQLGEFIDAPVKTYSSGMRVRLGYSVAAHMRPDILLLDEVLAVGDVGFRMKCFAHLAKLRDSGTAIILVSHALGAVSRVASRVVVFGNGQKAFDGELEPGIAAYQEWVGVQSSKGEPSKPTDTTLGKQASITGIRLLDEAGRPKKEFRTGDCLRLQLRIESNVVEPNARINVQLFSPTHGRLAGVSSAFQDQKIDLNVGSMMVEFSMPKLPLLTGAYYLDLDLLGKENVDLFDKLRSVGHFRVANTGFFNPGFGVVGAIQIDHDWRVGTGST